MIKTLIIFLVLSVINVALQTAKSLITIKAGKFPSAIINAITYGVYTVLLVYINCDLNLWAKVLITAGANFIGVYIVKYIEERARKDKIWKIEGIFPVETWQELENELDKRKTEFSYYCEPIFSKNKMLYTFYAYTQNDTILIHELFDRYKITKYFITETKNF